MTSRGMGRDLRWFQQLSSSCVLSWVASVAEFSYEVFDADDEW